MRVGVPVGIFCRHSLLRSELLAAYPDAKMRDSMSVCSGDELIAFLRDCDAAILGRERIDEAFLAALPGLRVIGKFGVGCEDVDFEAVHRHGVRFGYTPGVNKLAVAELALAFAIAGLRGIIATNVTMRAGLRPMQNLGRLLTGRVVGIHGCGNVGKELVKMLQPFHCTILACDIRDYREFYTAYGVTAVSFEDLIRRSEILSIHLPQNVATRGLYSRAVLQNLRADCVLINTSRGEIVDEDALRDSLRAGKLTAACFDVFAVEPVEDDELLALPNFLATPHIGASTEETRVAMGRAAIAGLRVNTVPAADFEP